VVCPAAAGAGSRESGGGGSVEPSGSGETGSAGGVVGVGALGAGGTSALASCSSRPVRNTSPTPRASTPKVVFITSGFLLFVDSLASTRLIASRIYALTDRLRQPWNYSSTTNKLRS